MIATVTTTPAVIWLFAILTGPPTERPRIEILFKTSVQATCQLQADEWNKQNAAQKLTAVCLPHRQKELLSDTDTQNE